MPGRNPSTASGSRGIDLDRGAAELRSLRLLVGGLAHDFNNLLTAIAGHASLLETEAEPGSETHESSTAILKAADRASAIARKLQSIAQKGKALREPVDVHEIIGEVSTLLKPSTNGSIEVAQCFGTPAARVVGDPEQIHQLVLNLALNALDAMPNGGRLTFETQVGRAPEPGPLGGDASATYLIISVRDTGCGISDANRARIFEPFFTSRASGEGTGLGLTVVSGIVEQHQGTIHLESQEGRGSAFHVYLPLLDGASA